METENKVDFTKVDLISDGWKETGNQMFILEKQIPNRNPISSPEDCDIKLVVHGLANAWGFAVLFPSGAMLNFVANRFVDLKTFENAINYYDPEF